MGDWVYRSNQYTNTTPATISDTLGTYDANVRTLTTGVATANTLVLVESQNRILHVTAGPAVNQMSIGGGQARPDDKGRKCLRVQGHIYIEPSTWAIGNIMAIGVRIGAFEQDLTGVASVDALYTMWNNNTPSVPAAYWSNQGRTTLWSRRFYKGFSANDQTIMVVQVNAKINCRLNPHEALMLWLEGESTSVNMRYQTWLRTWVSRF